MNSEKSLEYTFKVELFANSGCQYFFFPLTMRSGGIVPELQTLRETCWIDVTGFGSRHETLKNISGFTDLASFFDAIPKDVSMEDDPQKWRVVEVGLGKTKKRLEYVRYRMAEKRLDFVNVVRGLEIAIDSTTSGGNEDEDRAKGFYLSDEQILRSDPRWGAAQPASVYHAIKNEVPTTLPILVYDWDRSLDIRFEVTLYFKPAAVVHEHHADIVVDIGNTRTVALLVQDSRQDTSRESKEKIQPNALKQCFRPLMLQLDMRSGAVTRSDLSDVRNSTISSWFVLHESEFSDFERSDSPERLVQRRYISETVKTGIFGRSTSIREEQRCPNMFVKCSPVLLGAAAEQSLNNSQVNANLLQKGLVFQQSSPKRYFTDDVPQNNLWMMIPNDMRCEFPRLAANALYWIDERGNFFDRLECGNVNMTLPPMRDPEKPAYPRKITLVWFLLAVLERAWEQINDSTDKVKTYVPYKLRNVIITYPSGWTEDEQQMYADQCMMAIKIFERMMFSSSGKIGLKMSVDEAVASQLPYVFSEIHRLGDVGQNWLRLVGRRRNGGDRPMARVMNFDIGGGTTDIAIVEYDVNGDEDHNRIDELRPRLLFKDGFSLAGDDVLRKLLKDVVFRAFMSSDGIIGEEVRRIFTGSQDSGHSLQRARILKSCLIPLGIKIMQDLASGTTDGILRWRDIGISNSAWDEFGAYVEQGNTYAQASNVWYQKTDELFYSVDDARRIIREMFKRTFEECARIAVLHDIDIFFMSGKTSELPPLRELAEEYIPLTLDRIVSAKDYCAGAWYPFTDEHSRIVDAKSVTAVGAALSHMLTECAVSNWQLWPMEIALSNISTWGLMQDLMPGRGGADKAFEFRRTSTPGIYETRRPVQALSSGIRIGRVTELNKMPEPVYELVAPDGIELSIVFLLNTGNGGLEKLEIGCAVDSSGTDVTSECRLKPNQMSEDADTREFWQDSGRVVL